MKLIKVAGAVLNQTPLAWQQNKQNILGAIKEAKEQQVSILCLPELCISGYGCEDAFYAPGVHKTSLGILHEIVAHTHDIIVTLGLPLFYQNRIFNAACLIVDGKIAGFVAKRYLAGNGVHYEPRWFTPWPNSQQATITIDGKNYIIGDIHFNIGGIKIGFEICEDAWVAHRPGRTLYQYGVDLILNPSASHFAFDKLATRKRFVLEGSRAFGVGYIYTNLLGNEAGRVIYDGGTLIASSGKLLAVGERLTFDDFLVTSAILDIDVSRMDQSQNSNSFNVPQLSDSCVNLHYQYPEIVSTPAQGKGEAWENSPDIKEEEFTRAVGLGLFDYLRKSRSNGFVVSLSGGADSSAVASLCFLMLVLGSESIGIENMKQKLQYLTNIQELNDIKDISYQLLTCVYQATENSSATTRKAAQSVAEAIHAKYYEFDVDEIVKRYIQTVSASIKRPLTWETDDTSLQNIQARVRAPGAWMLANIHHALLLSTSNRSEAAVGYATMDGDTSGGLSPIAGIDKQFLRKWLVWLEKKGIDNEIRIPALHDVNVQRPTAELRPESAKQTDEDDLMPYDILGKIEEIAIRDKKMPLECFKLMHHLYPQFSAGQLKEWISKFFRLWSYNQWKRERYAPSFHLDDKNLDPKTWCRFPILSGSFEQEIEEMLQYHT